MKRPTLSVYVLLVTVLSVIAWASAAQTAHADGIIIPEPPICIDCPVPPPPEPIWLTVKYHHVDVTIKDQVAVTHVDQVFVNESDWQIEGTYIFPLPADAAVSDFGMWVDGKKYEGELLDRDQARRIYEEIVRRRRDPALLEYIDRGAFRVSIFPIPAGEERRVELEYSQVLSIDNGLVQYSYPLDTERFSARPLEEVSISVSIESQDAIKAIYSPSHAVVVARDGDYRAQVGYEEEDVLPEENFELMYTVSPQDVGLNLLSFKEGDAAGFFLMLVAPQVESERAEVVDKDVLLILDTSGSMEGEKLEQAKAALSYVLEHLNAGDRFNITDFSTGVRQYAGSPQPADQRDEAISWVRSLESRGGTDINRALLETLSSVDPARPTILIFLTDGQPTEGEVETDRILSNFNAATLPNVRLFAFGVGDDVNTVLLDTLSQEQRGTSGYVRPGERIDEEVSAFYAKVSTPLLTDITVEITGVQVEDVYPYPLPDLFAGTQLVVVGRYQEGGAALVQLAGQVNAEAERFTYEAFFEESGGDRFIPRLWATRKIGYLLNQIRLHGESQELVDEVVELSIRYGIVTPYTSYLVQEGADVLTQEGRREMAADAYDALAATQAPVAGSAAVEEAEAKAAIENAVRAAPPAGKAAGMVKVVGDKTFVYREGVWTDTVFDPSEGAPQPVGFGSETYFDLLAARPDMGRYFALGDRVIVVLDGTAYEVVEGAGGSIDLPPTATPPSGSGISPATPGVDAVSTPTPADPVVAQQRSGFGALCPGAALAGLILMPFGATFWWRRRLPR